MKLFAAYTNYGAALVDYSALQAGGFNPFLRDLYQCTITPFHICAFGGVKIDLPSDELDEAVEHLRSLESVPAGEFDPIEPKPIRDLGLTALATIGFFPGVFLAIAFPIIILLGFPSRQGSGVSLLTYGMFLCIGVCVSLIILRSRRAAPADQER